MTQNIHTTRSARLGFRFLILMTVLALCAPALAQERNPRWAAPLDLPPAENFYRVSPGLYRAAQPSAEAFREFEKLGIKTVINLRSRHSDRKYLSGDSTLNLIEVPMKAGKIGDQEVITVLRLIKNEPGPVLIHCMHGADRTGLMVAMYRIVFENWTKEEALDELTNGGYGFHSIWKNIPEYIREVDVDRIRAAVLIKNADIEKSGRPGEGDGAKRLVEKPIKSAAEQKSHFLLCYDQARQADQA